MWQFFSMLPFLFASLFKHHLSCKSRRDIFAHLWNKEIHRSSFNRQSTSSWITGLINCNLLSTIIGCCKIVETVSSGSDENNSMLPWHWCWLFVKKIFNTDRPNGSFSLLNETLMCFVTKTLSIIWAMLHFLRMYSHKRCRYHLNINIAHEQGLACSYFLHKGWFTGFA